MDLECDDASTIAGIPESVLSPFVSIPNDDDTGCRKSKKPMSSVLYGGGGGGGGGGAGGAGHASDRGPPEKKKRVSPRTSKDIQNGSILVPAVELPEAKPKGILQSNRSRSYKLEGEALKKVMKTPGYQDKNMWLGWFYKKEDKTYPYPYVIWKGNQPRPLSVTITRSLFPTFLRRTTKGFSNHEILKRLRLLFGEGGEESIPTEEGPSLASIVWRKVKKVGFYVDVTREFDGRFVTMKSPVTSRRRLEEAFHRLHPTSTRHEGKNKRRRQQGSVGKSELGLDENLFDFSSSSRSSFTLPLYNEEEELLPLSKEALEESDRKLVREMQRTETECEDLRKTLKEKEDTKSLCATRREEIQEQILELTEKNEIAEACRDLLMKVMPLKTLKTFRASLERAKGWPAPRYPGYEKSSSNSDEDTSDDEASDDSSDLQGFIQESSEEPGEEEESITAVATSQTPSRKRRRSRKKSPDKSSRGGTKNDRHYYRRKNKELETQEELLKKNNGDTPKEQQQQQQQKPQKRRRERKKRKITRLPEH